MGGIVFILWHSSKQSKIVQGLSLKRAKGEEITKDELDTYNKWKVSAPTTRFKYTAIVWIFLTIIMAVAVYTYLETVKVSKLTVEEVDGIFVSIHYVDNL